MSLLVWGAIEKKKFTKNQYLEDSKLFYSVFDLIDWYTSPILQFYKGGISLKEINSIGYADAIKILDFYLDTMDFRVTQNKTNV